MLKNKMIQKWVLAFTVAVGIGTSTTAFAKTNFSGEYRQGEILSLGSSLNQQEEAELREYFGVPSDMKAIYVGNETAIEQLGLEPDALDNYTGGWYSSAYVKLTDQGGVQVTSKNVNLVTNEMFANALITSGILNCEVNVSAPFMVTGESALAGILAGAEEIMGESLSEENKVVAKEEIDTTLDVADEILNNENNEINSTADSSTIASGIMNDIKEQVIKDSPNSTQIGQIIVNVTNNYGVELSEETQARVQTLMEDVNGLDIEYKDIKETMSNIGDRISESLKEAGIKLQESGFFEKIGNWFSELFQNVMNWVKDLFGWTDEVEVIPEEENQINTEESIVIEESAEGSKTDEVLQETINDTESDVIQEEAEAPAEETVTDEIQEQNQEEVVGDHHSEITVDSEEQETMTEIVSE